MKVAFLILFSLICSLSFGQYNEGDNHLSIYDIYQGSNVKSDDLIITIYSDTLKCNIEEVTTGTIIYSSNGFEEYIFLSEVNQYIITEENGKEIIKFPAKLD